MTGIRTELHQDNKKLKKELDRWFSKYIRLRDSKDGKGNCITCNKYEFISKMDAGHFVSRIYNITRFDERNVNLQCKGCNGQRKGEQFLHGIEIDKKYGCGTAEQLMNLRKKTLKLTTGYYIAQIEYYKRKVKELE